MVGVVLRDGRRVEVGRMRPTDHDALRRFYEGLSPRSRHMRFFGSLPPLEGEEGRRVLAGPERGVPGIVARSDTEIVGEARCFPTRPGEAELGMAVADEFQDDGLGSALLDALIDLAADLGLRRLVVTTLGSNQGMRELVARRGSAVLVNPPSFETLQFSLRARDPMPGWSEPHDRTRVLVEGWNRTGREAARLAEAAGCDVAVCAGPRPLYGQRGGRWRCPLVREGRCPLAEDADAVVFTLPLRRPGARAVLEAHRAVHPSTPVRIESTARAAGRPTLLDTRGLTNGRPAAR